MFHIRRFNIWCTNIAVLASCQKHTSYAEGSNILAVRATLSALISQLRVFGKIKADPVVEVMGNRPSNGDSADIFEEWRLTLVEFGVVLRDGERHLPIIDRYAFVSL